MNRNKIESRRLRRQEAKDKKEKLALNREKIVVLRGMLINAERDGELTVIRKCKGRIRELEQQIKYMGG